MLMRTTPGGALRAPRAMLGPFLGAIGVAFAAAICIKLAGAPGLALPLLGAAAVLLLQRPLIVCLVLLGLVVVAESQSGGLIHAGGLYDPLVPKGPSVIDTAIIALGGALVIERRRSRQGLILPHPFVAPTLLLALCLLIGMVYGHANGAGLSDVILQAKPVLYLIVVPVLVCNALDRPGALRFAVLAISGLALFKAVTGLLALELGQGAASVENGTQITYYEPAANFVMLLGVLLALAAVMGRIALPRWARWGPLLALVALVLSYRRSFWIAGIFAILLVVAFGAGPVARRLLVPVAALVCLCGWVMISSGIVTEVQGPVASRAASLSPTKVSTNAEDRYRLDERRNVLAEIRQNPLFGLGIAVPWEQRYPLSVEHPDGQDYVHMTVLWYWLKLGLFGTISYLWLSFAAIWTGLKVWSEHPTGIVRAAGLAIGAGVAGLMAAELTASFTGVDQRLTIVVAAALGLLGAARHDMASRERIT